MIQHVSRGNVTKWLNCQIQWAI